MKKIFFSLVGLLAAMTTVQAQDTATCDISVALTSPSANLEVPYGDTAFLSFTYTNHGPDVLPAGDTLFFAATGNIVLYSRLFQDVPVNGGIVMNNIVYYFNPTQDSINMDVCIVHIPQASVNYTGGGHPVTTYIDDDTTNDRSCVSILLKGPQPSSIFERNTAAAGLTLYPNPATDQVYIDIAVTDNRKSLPVTIRDITGRVVSVQTLQTIRAAGAQKYTLDVSALKSGIYFAELSPGDKPARGKFVISR